MNRNAFCCRLETVLCASLWSNWSRALFSTSKKMLFTHLLLCHSSANRLLLNSSFDSIDLNDSNTYLMHVVSTNTYCERSTVKSVPSKLDLNAPQVEHYVVLDVHSSAVPLRSMRNNSFDVETASLRSVDTRYVHRTHTVNTLNIIVLKCRWVVSMQLHASGKKTCLERLPSRENFHKFCKKTSHPRAVLDAISCHLLWCF